MTIICKICNKIIADPYYYKRHLYLHLEKDGSNQTLSNEIENIGIKLKKNYRCEKCEKTYVSEYTLKKHQNTTCNNNNNPIDKLVNKTNDPDTLLEWRNLIDHKLQSAGGKIEIGNNISVSNLNIQNLNQNCGNVQVNFNISLKSLGDENINQLKEELAECQERLHEMAYDETNGIDYIKNIAKEIFQNIHFDPENPEHHNIYITDSRPSAPFMIYNNDKWEKTGSLEDLEKDWLKITEMVKDAIQHKNPRRMIQMKQAIEHTLNHYNNARIAKRNRVDKEMSKKFHEIAYNNKDVVKPTFEKTKTLNLIPKKRLRLKNSNH